MRGVGRITVLAKLEHPSSVACGDTFSHKGRRERQRRSLCTMAAAGSRNAREMLGLACA
jgi:hypothetical protein